MRAIREGAYSMTRLGEYVGPEIDWAYPTTALMLDRLLRAWDT